MFPHKSCGSRSPRLLSGSFGPKQGPGDWRWTSHSPTGSGPEGSSPNEVRIGSLVSLLPVFSSEARQAVGAVALEFAASAYSAKVGTDLLRNQVYADCVYLSALEYAQVK